MSNKNILQNNNTFLNNNNNDLNLLLNKINNLPKTSKIASGSFVSDGHYGNVLQINNLDFTPTNIIIESRKKVTLYGGVYNVEILCLGTLFDSCQSRNSAQSPSGRLSLASSYATFEGFEGGCVLTIGGGLSFGQSTYYWTVIGE